MALQYALMFYSRDYEQMIIETDYRLSLDHLSIPDRFIGPYAIDLQRTIQFLSLTASSLQYCPRKVNMAAHALSRHGL